MNRLRRLLPVGSLYVGLATLVASPQQNSPAPAHTDKTQAEIPVTVIHFGAPKLLSENASPMIVDPMQCSADGKAFIEMVLDDDVLRRPLYSVSSNGDVFVFDRINLPGLRDVQVTAYFPGESHVVSLISARPVSTGQDRGAAKLPPVNYLVVQDPKGQRTKVLDLKLRIKPSQVAELNSGRFLVIGVEPINNLPELELLESDGSFVRQLDVEGTTYGGSPSIAQVFGDTAKSDLRAVLGWSHFVPWGQQVLLVQGGSRLPVFVIGEGGIQRTVKIAVPQTLELESIIPMQASWLVRMKSVEDSKRLAGQNVVYGMQSRLYEVDSSTGELIREVMPPIDMRTNEIVCAANNQFLALHLIYKSKDDDKPQLGLFIGAN